MRYHGTLIFLQEISATYNENKVQIYVILKVPQPEI